MRRLRLWLAIYTFWLLLFYNIERFDETINLASFLYLLIPFTVVLILLFPRLLVGKNSGYVIGGLILVALLLKQLLGYTIVDTGLAITVTELSFIIINLLLLKPLAQIIIDVEDMVTKLTFRQIGLPPRLLESIDTEDLYRELKRCRRFQHPVVLLYVETEGDMNDDAVETIMKELNQSIIERYMQARVAKLLSEDLRDSDLIAQHADGFIVLMPETQIDEIDDLLKMIRYEAINKLHTPLKIGVSTFPDEALTLGGLIEAATTSMGKY
jgi:hypothetical protein